MGKSNRKNTEDDAVPVEEGTALSTLRIARFFFDEARPLERKERKNIEEYENYVMAAIVFARSVLWNIKGEFAYKQKKRKQKNSREKKEEKDQFTKWIEDHERHPLIEKLIASRTTIIHKHPISSRRPISKTTTQEDRWHYDESSQEISDEPSQEISEAYEKLSDQLDKVESIIKEFEEKYK